MKKIILLILVAFTANVAFAQNCKKTCDMKNTYVQSGDLIEAKLYHDNGTLAQTGFYTNDNKLQGEWISYDAQGNRTAVAHYNNGEKTGTWLFFQGNIKKEVTYIDSKISEVKTWEITDKRVVTNKP